MRDKLTKQGVRDLNGPTKNARVIPRQAACFHEWGHDPECYVCREGYRVGSCIETCVKCGKFRS